MKLRSHKLTKWNLRINSRFHFCHAKNREFILWFLAIIFLCFGNYSFALDNPEQKVSEVIKNYVVGKNPAWSKDDLRLTFRMAESVFTEMKTWPDETSLSVIEVYPDFRPVGSVVFPIEAKAGETSQRFMIRANVGAFKPVAAAARLIKKGKAIEAADLKLEARDIALLPQKYFSDLKALIGKEAKLTIPQNSTLFEWMAGEVPLVHRGDEVSLVVAGAALAVRTRARALEDGYLNGDIRVKRADSKLIISGKLVSKDQVEVKL